jgi:hypothetical protein
MNAVAEKLDFAVGARRLNCGPAKSTVFWTLIIKTPTTLVSFIFYLSEAIKNFQTMVESPTVNSY